MYPPLEYFIENLDVDLISKERKELFDTVAAHLGAKFRDNQRVNITCICTHNSRRSHLCQVWAKTAAMYYRLRKFNSYSGGTEVTAVNQQIIWTLANQGFQIMNLAEQDNPVYALKYANDLPAIHLFSKKYDHDYNPNEDFTAFMNCNHADLNCPTVYGCDTRFKIDYQDPKRSDGTPEQAEIYSKTSELIAREMFYLFGSI